MKLILDLYNKDWIMEGEPDPQYDYIDFYFAFTQDGQNYVEFDNLKFGYVILDQEDIMKWNSYPLSGITYVSTDQQHLEVDRVFGFRPNMTYFITAWAENAGDYFEEQMSFFVPIPESPYPSWSWNDDLAKWEPPFQPPQDGQLYEWDETNQTWNVAVLGQD